MDKEKILAAAKNEKRKGHEFEDKVMFRGDTWAVIFTCLISLILLGIEYFSKGTLNTGIITVSMTTVAVENLHTGFKLKKKLYSVSGIICLLMAFIAGFVFITETVSA